MILDNFINGKKTFALELDGKVIGSLGIETYNPEKYPDLERLQGRSIGYVLSKDYWGQGFMPEAVKAVQRHLFETAGLDFLLISHFVWNGQSRRVIQKCGFQYLQTSIYETRYGTTEDTMVYILKKEDWEHAQA